MVWRLIKIVALLLLWIFSVKKDFRWGYRNMNVSWRKVHCHRFNHFCTSQSKKEIQKCIVLNNKDVCLLFVWRSETNVLGCRTRLLLVIQGSGFPPVFLPDSKGKSTCPNLGCCHAGIASTGKEESEDGTHPWSESLNPEIAHFLLLPEEMGRFHRVARKALQETPRMGGWGFVVRFIAEAKSKDCPWAPSVPFRPSHHEKSPTLSSSRPVQRPRSKSAVPLAQPRPLFVTIWLA